MGLFVAGVDFLEMGAIESTSQKAIINFFGLIGTFLIVWIFTSAVYKESFMSLGFSIKGRVKDIIAGLVTGILVMAASFFLLLILNEIYIESIIFDLKKIVWLFLLFVIVAFVEEVLCRGFILGNLMVSFRKYIALLVSALVFMILHAINPNVSWLGLLNLFLAGILLGLPYIFTKNLWLPVSLHFSWNFFQSLFGFHVSGFEVYSIIEISRDENNLFNGGEFGFEGSILSTLLLLLIILCFYSFYEKSGDTSSPHLSQ